MTARHGLSADVLDDLDWWTRPVSERDALFAWLRAANPRPFAPELDLSGNPRGGGFWALTRMDDIREVSRRPDDFCSGKGINIFDQPPGLKDYRGSFIDMDNPEHARLRRIVSRGFAAKSLEAISGLTWTGAAREIIGSVADKGECDFVTEVAALLPLRIVNNMLGIPRSEEQFIFEQTNIIMAASDSEYVSDQTPRGIARAVGAAGQRLADLLHGLAEDRIKSPRGDLISLLVAATAEENLTPDELAAFFILLVGAGNETTRNAISHGLLALTEFPSSGRCGRAIPRPHTARAVEEVVRWASPVLHMRRTVTRDGVRLGDQEFAEGDKVVLWYRSANQDEDYFTDADGVRHHPRAQPARHLRLARDRTTASAPTWPGWSSRSRSACSSSCCPISARSARPIRCGPTSCTASSTCAPSSPRRPRGGGRMKRAGDTA